MKYNLKNNPELFKEHHRISNRKYYYKNREKILQKKREKNYDFKICKKLFY